MAPVVRKRGCQYVRNKLPRSKLRSIQDSKERSKLRGI
jgi:hypothetical protein